MSLDLLKRADRAELAALRRSARRERRRSTWAWWVGLWKRAGRNLQIAVTVVGGVAALASGVPAAIKGVSALASGIRKASALFHARDIAPAETQATGIHSTAFDRVDHPKKTAIK